MRTIKHGKKDLCVSIKSQYDDFYVGAEAWNNEVESDSLSVEITLLTHTIVPIEIDSNITDPQIIAKKVREKLTAEIQDKDYETCHIVVNTHGAAGVSDLPDLAAQTILQVVSDKNIKITQLSLLQCNAMSAKGGKGTSSADILRGKLCSTQTSIPQEFKIVGPTKAYDPEKNEELVSNILNGDDSDEQIASLTVIAKGPVSEEKYALGVLADIQLIEDTQKSLPPNLDARNKEHREIIKKAKETPSYSNAANSIQGLLEKMKSELRDGYIQKTPSIKSEHAALHSSLQRYAQSNGMSLDSADDLDKVYEGWMKQNRTASSERLDVCREYCKTSIAKEKCVSSKTQLQADKAMHEKKQPALEDQMFSSKTISF